MFSPATVPFFCLLLIAVVNAQPYLPSASKLSLREGDSDADNDKLESTGIFQENLNNSGRVKRDAIYGMPYKNRTRRNRGGCFPGESLTVLEGGAKKSIKDLSIGDVVITVDNGNLVSTKVLGFLDKRINQTTDYLNLHTEDGRSLRISRTHAIFIRGEDDGMKSVLAEEVSPGDMVVTEEGLSQVKQVTTVPMEGAYVPLTDAGTLLVDGVLVSCYTNADHWLAHLVLAPLRWWPSLLLDTEESQHTGGIRTYPWMVKNLGYFLGLAKVSTPVDETETVEIPGWEISTPRLSLNKMVDEF